MISCYLGWIKSPLLLRILRLPFPPYHHGSDAASLDIVPLSRRASCKPLIPQHGAEVRTSLTRVPLRSFPTAHFKAGPIWGKLRSPRHLLLRGPSSRCPLPSWQWLSSFSPSQPTFYEDQFKTPPTARRIIDFGTSPQYPSQRPHSCALACPPLPRMRLLRRGT